MKKVGIIGFGRFGKTLHRLLQGDFDVTLFDTDKSAFKNFKKSKYTGITQDLAEVYKNEVIFYCVPISKFESVIESHKKYFKNEHLLIDILSVKELPERIFLENLKGLKTQAILTHPMFGPDSSKDGFKGLRMVMDRFMSSKKQYDFWKKYFISKGLEVVELSARKHDELAARSQGVTHFVGRLLSDYGFPKTPIDTKGAEWLHKVADQTTNDSWELFTNLQNYNRHTKQMRIRLGRAYDRLYNKLLPKRINPDYIIFGIQGGRGSFNEQAILSYIKSKKISGYKIEYLYTSEKVLKNVHEGNVDFGLFATHNFIGGVGGGFIFGLSGYKFGIVEDVVIPIRHFLMKRKDVSSDNITRIMAHSQVFKQCKSTLTKRFPRFKLESGKGDLVDTARAAEALSLGRIPKTVAILGPKVLSELYDLEIIAENLQDDKINNTSFLLVTR